MLSALWIWGLYGRIIETSEKFLIFVQGPYVYLGVLAAYREQRVVWAQSKRVNVAFMLQREKAFRLVLGYIKQFNRLIDAQREYKSRTGVGTAVYVYVTPSVISNGHFVISDANHRLI